MSGLLYVGSNPNNASALGLKGDTDTAAAAAVVTTDYVNTTIAGAVGPLKTKSYVDAQDALRAKKTDVVNADAAFIARSTRGQASGVCPLDGAGKVPSANLPSGIPNDRVYAAYCLSTTQLGTTLTGAGVTGINYLGNLTHTSTTAGSLREYQIAKIVVPDPGFPWLPLPFAWVRGYAAGATPNIGYGNGNYGLVTVMPPSGNTKYAIGIGTDAVNRYGVVAVMPYAAPGATPTSVTGSLELSLYGNLWSGTDGYVYSGVQLQYMILVVPAL